MITSIARSWRLPTLSPYPDLCFVVLTEQGSGDPQRGTVNSFRSWAKKDRTVVPPAHRRFSPASAQHSGFFREGKDTHQKYHGGDNRIHRTGWVCCCGIQSATANLSCPCFFPTCKDGRNHTRCSNAVRSRRPTRTARCMPLASCLCSAAVVVAVAVGSSPVFRVMSVHPVGIPYCRHVCNQERTHACDTPGPEIQDDL